MNKMSYPMIYEQKEDTYMVATKEVILIYTLDTLTAYLENQNLVVYCNELSASVRNLCRYITLKEYMDMRGFNILFDNVSTAHQFFTTIRLLNRVPISLNLPNIQIDMSRTYIEHWMWSNPPTMNDVEEISISITNIHKGLIGLIKSLVHTGRHYSEDIAIFEYITESKISTGQLKYIYVNA